MARQWDRHIAPSGTAPYRPGVRIYKASMQDLEGQGTWVNYYSGCCSLKQYGPLTSYHCTLSEGVAVCENLLPRYLRVHDQTFGAWPKLVKNNCWRLLFMRIQPLSVFFNCDIQDSLISGNFSPAISHWCFIEYSYNTLHNRWTLACLQFVVLVLNYELLLKF